MSEICNFYFWRLQFEVPFRHFDKMKAFRQICLQATFSWTRQDYFFCLRPCFFTPEQNMALNGGRFCTCLCHSALEIAPCFLLFTSIRHFAIYWWQNRPFWPEIAHFSMWCFHQFHTKSFSSTPVNFSNFTCRVCKFDTWSFENPHVESAKPT